MRLDNESRARAMAYCAREEPPREPPRAIVGEDEVHFDIRLLMVPLVLLLTTRSSPIADGSKEYIVPGRYNLKV